MRGLTGRRPGVTRGLEAFRALSATGLGVVDVGSRGGLHRMFDEVAPLLAVVGFEVDAEECMVLESERSPNFRTLTYLPFALGRADGEQVLHVCRSRGNSSFYKPNRFFLDRFPDADRFEVVASQQVPVRALDSVARDPAVAMPAFVDFMKLDTQGSELDVLHGARKTLSDDVVAIEIEIEFSPLYEAQPLFRDVDAFLAECGFTMFKLRRVEWVRRALAHRPRHTSGQLTFGQALYLKDPLNPRLPWAPATAHGVEAVVLLAVLYDLSDFALEVTEDPRTTDMVDARGLRRYVLERADTLGHPWNPLRYVRAWRNRRRLENWLSWRDRFCGYAPNWGRADSNFYTRI